MTNGTATVITSVGSVLGNLVPLLNSHNQATTQVSQILMEINQAAAAGDYSQVEVFANTIMGIPGVSVSVMDNARTIAKAAANAMVTSGATSGLPPAQAAVAAMGAQQLIMAGVAAAAAQVASENSSIWNNIWHLHSVAVTGVSPTA